MINKLLGPIFELLPENNRWERVWKIAQVDFRKRYYNDKLGLLWALINPLLQVFVYWLAFTKIMNRGGSNDAIKNFALFIFIGIVFYSIFVETSRKAIKVLYAKRYLIENIRVNKIDLFLSNSIASFLGFAFNICAVIIFCWLFSYEPNFRYLWIPVLMFNLFLIATGFGMILAVSYIYVKDIYHVLDMVFLLGFWTSGVFFPKEAIIEFWPPLYYINPFIGILSNARHIMMRNDFPEQLDFNIMVINLLIGITFYIIGSILIKNKSHLAIERG